jgi:hypothetical protein
MTIGTPVQLGSTSGAGGAAMTLALTTLADAPAGSLIVVLVGWVHNAAISSVADSAGNTYAGGNSLTLGTSRFRPFWCFTAVDLPSGGTITATYTIVTGVKLIGAVAVSGCAAVDQQATGSTNTSTTPGQATGTLGWPNEIIFGMCQVASGAGDTYTEASGFTANTPALMTDALRWAYQIVASNASVTYAPGLGTSRTWGANTLTFSGAVASPFNRAVQFTYLGM